MNTEYKSNNKQSILCYDIVFKTIFTKHPNLLARLISDITDISYELLENNIRLETNELPISQNNEKAKRCDFIVKYDKNSIINIEINKDSYTGLIIKNFSYICNLFSSSFSKGEQYDENILVLQININAFKEADKSTLSKYLFKAENSDKTYIENMIIYTLNVVNCYDVYYNYHNNLKERYINWGALIYSHTLEEIDKISKNILTDKERKSLMEELNKITSSDWFMTAEESIRLAEWEKSMMLKDAKNEGLELGKSEGIKLGKSEGIEQEKINTIKEMIKNNLEIELISKITGKSIEEIKEISKNN